MRRLIQERIRKRARGVDLALDLNADIAVNVNRSSAPARGAERIADRAGAPRSADSAPERRSKRRAS